LLVAASGQTNRLSLVPVTSNATGEVPGNTSRYLAEAPWLRGLKEFTVTIPEVEIRGQRFTSITFSYPAAPRP
jgi:hypothetical protein